jgi:hypothetical protein
MVTLLNPKFKNISLAISKIFSLIRTANIEWKLLKQK